MRLLVLTNIYIFLFFPVFSYGKIAPCISNDICKKAEVSISNSPLSFICDKNISIPGIDYYKESYFHHIVMLIDLGKIEIVPMIPKEGLIPEEGINRKDCIVPPSKDKFGLEGFCQIATQSLYSFYNDVKNKDPFAVISGTFQGTEDDSQKLDKLSFFYKINNYVLYKGEEMDNSEFKKALVLYGKRGERAEIASIPSSKEKGALEHFMENYPGKNIVTGLDVNVDKRSNMDIGRLFAGTFDSGRKIAILVSDKYIPMISRGLSQREAINVLKSFSIEEKNMIMFDGGGSAQAVIRGRTFLNGDGRFLTNAFAIYDRTQKCNSYFFDMEPDHDFYCYVKDLGEKCVVNGDKNRDFNPGKPIRRWEFLKMVILAAQKLCGKNGNLCTKDVPYKDMQGLKNDYSYKYVKAAYNLGLIVYDDEHKNFGPFGNIDRGQAAEILVRYLASDKEHPEKDEGYSENPPFQDLLKYKDLSSKPRFYRYAYAARSVHNILQGHALDEESKGKDCNGVYGTYEYNHFCPENDISRGEVAKIIDRTFFPEVKNSIN